MIFRGRLGLGGFLQPCRVAALFDCRFWIMYGCLLAIVDQRTLHSLYLGTQVVIVHYWTVVVRSVRDIRVLLHLQARHY